MLATSTIFQGADQNILAGATITASVAPRTNYVLAALGFARPDMRICWNTRTLRVTWTLAGGSPPEPQLGDILMLPISNLVSGGSPAATVRVLNDAGLDVDLDLPIPDRSGFPRTYALDLTEAEPNEAKRTAAVWALDVVDNPVDITLGGGFAIYGPKTRLLDRDVKWGYTRRTRRPPRPPENAYLVELGPTINAQRRGCDLETLATDADADAIEAWFDGNAGRAGLLWVRDFEDPYFGCWDADFRRTVGANEVPDTNLIQIGFTELSKGLPLL